MIYTSTDGWANNALRTISFVSGNDLSNASFVAWVKANAVLISQKPVDIKYGSLNTLSDVTTPYTLQTSGKIMAANLSIDSTLKLQEKTATSNGEVTPDAGVDGLSCVIVDVPTGSTIDNEDLNITLTSQSASYQASAGHTGIGQITVTAQTATPAFTGGNLTAEEISAGMTGTNTTLSTTNTSGIAVIATPEAYINRASVLYNGAVNGWVNKSDGAVALSGAAEIQLVGSAQTRYINSVTVPSGKTFTVTNNGTTNVTGGTVNINGGLADKGVQVKANKEVIVDNMGSFPVTYATTTTVNGTTYQAGDLKVPVLSGTSLEFPSGFATPTTVTATVNGTVTMINGAQVKDTSTNVVRGSSTLTSTATYTSYLAKFSGTNTITTGPKVEITTTTPTSTTGYRAGDIVFVV